MQTYLAPILVLGILLSACGVTSPAASVQDCGVLAADGESCFYQAMDTCSPATVMIFEKVPPLSARIEGGDGSVCRMSLRGIGKAEIDKTMLENSASQWEVDDLNARIDGMAGFQGLAGKTASCSVERSELPRFVNGTFMDRCSGPLIDEIRKLALVR
ncbi:MAG: hypothetical protein U0R44_01215 [Candidatus Micrarchaeia archaeon]